MSSLNKRIEFLGGNTEGRLKLAKLKTLKKAMFSAYQGATAILADGREFRCLINPDKLNNDLDNKIISIPFSDICLNKDRIGTTTEGEEIIGLKAGDVIEWKENATRWIVLLQRLEETAYFRADLRRCKEIEINRQRIWGWLKGPREQSLSWENGSRMFLNELNYSATLYVGKTPENLEYLKRFSIIKIEGNTYEVQATDSITVPGIIEVYLKEYYNNSIKEDAEKELQESTQPPSPLHGPTIVHQYDTATFFTDIPGGSWSISNPSLVKLKFKSYESIIVSIVGMSGTFTLAYKVNDQTYTLNVTIES